MTKRSRAPISLAIVTAMFAGYSFHGLDAQAGQASTAPIEFNRDIRPILANSCASCHGTGVDATRVNPRLDAAAIIRTGLVRPGNADESLLFQRLTPDHYADRSASTSPARTLTRDQIETVRMWIDSGAMWRDDPRTVGLSGRVLDARDGSPIGAVIHLLQVTDREVLGRSVDTDSSGVFRLADLAVAPIELRVEADDYGHERVELNLEDILGGDARWRVESLPRSVGQSTTINRTDNLHWPGIGIAGDPADTDPLHPSSHSLDMTIGLHRLATLTGHVVDDHGNGIEGATVAVGASESTHQWLHTQVPATSVATLADGAFSIKVATDLDVRLEITKKGCEAWMSEHMRIDDTGDRHVFTIELTCPGESR